MANRKDFFYKQKVTQAELDAAFAYTEQDRMNWPADNSLYGIVTGFTPSLGSAPTVDITTGTAYDQLGRRIKSYTDAASTKNFSYATATDGTPTSVTAGNERWISIFANFGRQALDSRTDGNGATVYHDQPECLHDGTTGVGGAGVGGSGVDKFKIVAGASATTGNAVRPTLLSNAILVCDILRTPSDASNQLSTTRRQPGPVQPLQDWLGGRTNPAGGIQAILDRIIGDLKATTASDDGAERIGAQAVGNLAAGSVRSQLTELDTEKGGLAVANTWTRTQSFADDTGNTATTPLITFSDTTDTTFRLMWRWGNTLNAKKWRLYSCMSTTTVWGVSFSKGALIFTWNAELNAPAQDVDSSPRFMFAINEANIVIGQQTASGSNWRTTTINMATDSGSTAHTVRFMGGAPYLALGGGVAGNSGTHYGVTNLKTEGAPSSASFTVTQDAFGAAVNTGTITFESNGSLSYAQKWSFTITAAGQYYKNASFAYT